MIERHPRLFLFFFFALGALAGLPGCSEDAEQAAPVATSGSTGGAGAAGGGGEGGNQTQDCTIDAECDDGIDCTADSCEGGVCEHVADDAPCDDGNFCNGVESCDSRDGCVAGPDPCDDGLACTIESCDEQSDSCTTAPDDAACDDGQYCNGLEVCDTVAGCVAGDDPCDDDVNCTADSCDEQSDSCTNMPSDAVCDDSMFCNGTETCDPQNGDPLTGCVAGTSPCSDTIGCTTDGCDEQADSCTYTPDNLMCDDGQFCNGAEVCDVLFGCVAGTDPCADNVPCTLDSCVESSDSCLNSPVQGLCDDSVFCNGSEICDPQVGCVQGPPPSCADGFTCTSDFCDINTDSCVSVEVDSNCNDGLYCNGAETCDIQNGAPGSGCVIGTPPDCNDQIGCTIDSCDNSTAACVHAPNHAPCDDGIYCNGQESCVQGAGCQAGNAVICNDGLTCTADSCNESAETCDFVPSDAFCDDGLFCNGGELCDPASPAPGSGCVAGNPFNCMDDGIACTDETCSESQMGCQSTPNSGNCPPGQLCIVSLGGCVPAQACTSDMQCDDLDDCNGVETCDLNLGICQQGTPVNCDDGINCTIDSCNPNGGTCSYVLNDSYCDDGFACTGVELCDAIQGCVPGTPVDCDDGVSCTYDLCTEPNAACLNIVDNAACDDGYYCTGQETCDPVNDCQPGTPPSCADNVACTADTCDLTVDQCVSVPDHSLCSCTETCDPQQGCGNYCQVTECQGKVYQCGDCIDNDGDCLVDSGPDPECFGPCDNNESGFKGNIPGQNSAPCKQDCYFDGDSGAGNDACYWSHECDPLEVPPNYPPEGSQCAYNPSASIPGTNMTCSQAQTTQSQLCLDYCGPLAPNGCDCFGCCEVPGLNYPVWLGSEVNGQGSCTTSTLTDPTQCKPCTIVTGCFNPCENCELCLGKPTLPPECTCQQCEPNQQLCGPPCGGSCPSTYFCNNGCCVQAP